MTHLAAYVVVGANRHNPSLINGDFVRTHGIVPEWFELDSGQPSVTMPMLAQLSYRDGWRLLVVPERLQVLKGGQADAQDLELMGRVVAAYAEALPSVPYTAVGTNFAVLVPQEEGARWLMERYLRRDIDVDGPVGIALMLRYNLDGGHLTLSLTEVAGTEAGAVSAIRVDANFHRECSIPDKVAAVAANAALAGDDKARFEALLRKLLPPEEDQR
jgi:hypothetical protein